MATILPTVNPKTNLGAVMKKVIDHSKLTQRPLSSAVDTTPNFPSHFMDFRGEYDPDAAYSVNDVITVLHDTNYSHSDSEDALDVTPGVYVCVLNIPGYLESQARQNAGISGGVYIRVANVDYHPKYPEPTVYYDDVKGTSSDPFTVANVRYWTLISLLPKQTTVCVDGVQDTYYVDLAPSESD